MADKKSKWASFGTAILNAGLIAAGVFGGRDLKTGVAIAQQSGALNALVDVITPDEEQVNHLEPLTDELQAKNEIIAAQQKQIDAMKKQIEQLSNAVTQLLAKAQVK